MLCILGFGAIHPSFPILGGFKGTMGILNHSLGIIIFHMIMVPQIFSPDLLWPLLRGDQPLQAVPHLHEQDLPNVYREKEKRGAALI